MPNGQLDNRFAVIGGSRGFRTLQRLCGSERLAPIQTPFGASAPVHKAEIGGVGFLFLSRHGETGYEVSAPFVNYRANIWALKELGAERIVAWSGPGAIDTTLMPGEILVPDDLVDETRRRASTFFEGLGIGFIRVSPTFCPELSGILRQVIEARQGHCRCHDIYVCTEGPRLETRAEIRKFASHGGTLVGMTLAPEAFLARELEVCYCPVCYITNYAEGVVERSFEPGKLFEGLLAEEDKARVETAVDSLLDIAVEALAGTPPARSCPCCTAMERYRRRGDIGEDWHEWI